MGLHCSDKQASIVQLRNSNIDVFEAGLQEGAHGGAGKTSSAKPCSALRMRTPSFSFFDEECCDGGGGSSAMSGLAHSPQTAVSASARQKGAASRSSHFFLRRFALRAFFSMRKSWGFLPALSLATNQRGLAPRPAQVSPVAGSRYLGATFRPLIELTRSPPLFADCVPGKPGELQVQFIGSLSEDSIKITSKFEKSINRHRRKVSFGHYPTPEKTYQLDVANADAQASLCITRLPIRAT